MEGYEIDIRILCSCDQNNEYYFISKRINEPSEFKEYANNIYDVYSEFNA